MPEGLLEIALVTLLLVLFTAYFVAVEYALISVRRSRIESLARQGNKSARLLLKELERLPRHVAGVQIAITMLGIGVGAYTEPSVTHLLTAMLGVAVDPRISYALSFLVVSFLLVVLGELTPKYATLHSPEHAALILIYPMRLITTLLNPLIVLAQGFSMVVLRPFGVHAQAHSRDAIEKEELLLLVQAGSMGGNLERPQADLVSRALRIDALVARDIMVHRLDVAWLDATLGREQTLARLKRIPYTRIPVCRGDIDDVVGIAYLHDIVVSIDSPTFSLETIAHAPVNVPENLPMERIVSQMRESRTQMLVVTDEYGGTSGIVTLEDVVEELFGDLEDRTETHRAAIELHQGGRISARGEVRIDELAWFLKLPSPFTEETDSLATVIVEALDRVPKTGDSVETELGTLRVENMARRRITRVGVWLRADLQAALSNGTEPS